MKIAPVWVLGLCVSYCFAATDLTNTLPPYYGKALCMHDKYFKCIKTSKGDTWESLFPNLVEREIVQRINRTDNRLWYGKELAVPVHMKGLNELDFAPFDRKIDSQGEKLIIVDQDKLAWGAFDSEGSLVKWGPISSGRDNCPDSANRCLTLTGVYRVFNKENEKCISDVFPIGRGGAKMPYCMFFHKGFALHGSDDIPGYRASHGCVRIFTRDAKWLNNDFVVVASDRNSYLGTLVVVKPVSNVDYNKGPRRVIEAKHKVIPNNQAIQGLAATNPAVNERVLSPREQRVNKQLFRFPFFGNAKSKDRLNTAAQTANNGRVS